MGTYASNSDVTDRLPGRTLNATSQPSTTNIDSWITTAEARLEAALMAVGATVPVTATRGIQILKELTTDYAEGRVRRALAAAGGDSSNTDGQELIDRFNEELKAIASDPAGVSAMTEGGSANDGTRRVRGTALDHPDGDTIAAGDFDPTFTRDEVF